MMVTWLVFYLAMINMGKEARIIAILWSVSTFIGGILGAYLNPGFNKIIFIAALLGSSIMFIFMEGIHLSNAEVEIMVMTIFCGLVYGGPFTLIGTCIPVMLGEIPEIKKHKGSKAAIISAM